MTGSDLTSQPMSTTMVETSNVASLSMFATSLEAHLYGGLSIPPGYYSLSSTFSSVASSLWTSPMPSILGIPSGTFVMNTTQLDPFPIYTPIVEQ